MPEPEPTAPPSTQSADYAERLETLEQKGWKQRLDVQAPYRWNVRRLDLGFVLDVGCGIGRNLSHLDGHGVGVDHNAACVATARSRGLTAYTPDEFLGSPDAQPGRFDALLLAHVLEHLDEDTGVELVGSYLPYVRPGGRLVVITPQEAGQKTDATHVRFVDTAAIERLAQRLGWRVQRARSFPFPRVIGKVFPYNEFVAVCERAAGT